MVRTNPLRAGEPQRAAGDETDGGHSLKCVAYRKAGWPRVRNALCYGWAARMPQWIGPDHLTVLGLVAQMGAGLCYALASRNKYALLGVIACLVLNWLGDSLDGTLARVRQQLRPRYGFYVDHMVDSFGALALMGGLALSGCIIPGSQSACWVAFLMLSIQSYLATYALGEFRLSVLALRSDRTAHPACSGKPGHVLEGASVSIRRVLQIVRRWGAIGFAGMGVDGGSLFTPAKTPRGFIAKKESPSETRN